MFLLDVDIYPELSTSTSTFYGWLLSWCCDESWWWWCSGQNWSACLLHLHPRLEGHKRAETALCSKFWSETLHCALSPVFALFIFHWPADLPLCNTLPRLNFAPQCCSDHCKGTCLHCLCTSLLLWAVQCLNWMQYCSVYIGCGNGVVQCIAM